MTEVSLLGIRVSNLTADELNREILKLARAKQKSLVLHVNIHAMNMAHQLPWFKNFLNSAAIIFCDGDGVRMGAKILGVEIKEKITYNRWIWQFAEWSSAHGLSWYLIGSETATIDKAVSTLRMKYPLLKVAGHRNGFFKDREDVSNTLRDINAKGPDVLILGMGMPIQEKWLADNWPQVNATIALTGGAVFEYVSGTAIITPDIFYKLKLEWFYRFMHDPKRLFKRYFVGNFVFLFRVLYSRLRRISPTRN